MERPAEDEAPERTPGPLSAVPEFPETERAPERPAEDAGAPKPRRARSRRLPKASPRELGALALMAAGIALVVLGWWGAAHSELFIDQVPYLISGGILGLGLIITAAVIGASSLNERALREIRRDLMTAMRMSPGGGQASEAASDVVLLVPGGRSYHVPGCPIPEGKQGVKETSLADAAGRGLVACKLCGPE